MVGPRGLSVDESAGRRWDHALEVLAEADPANTVIYRGIGLWLDRDRHGQEAPGLLTAAVHSSWEAERTTEATARQDLARAGDELEALRAASPDFGELMKGRHIEYVLMDDYGMGAIHLCVLGTDGLVWLTEPADET